MERRNFCKTSMVGGAIMMLPANLIPSPLGLSTDKPKTNIGDALKYERLPNSMPGMFPGKVVQVNHPGSVIDGKPVIEIADKMIAEGILKLTGKKKVSQAWRLLFGKNEKIALKVNPVAGELLTTSHAVTQSVIAQLTNAGIPKENLIIYDRREFQLHETGYNAENYPGIRIYGTECKDEQGSYLDAEGNLYSLNRIDKDWYYWADREMAYNEATMPFMVNDGKYSYFSKFITQEVDKIINLPILKNAGASVTLCMKNLSFGSITNTSRLHQALWSDTCAEVCAFPPLRDKVVLNIADGLIGCFDKGPGANPQFITEYKTILLGTDPVAVDRVGYEIVIKKRIEENIQTRESPKGREFMDMAQKLNLGIADLERINQSVINLV